MKKSKKAKKPKEKKKKEKKKKEKKKKKKEKKPAEDSDEDIDNECDRVLAAAGLKANNSFASLSSMFFSVSNITSKLIL